MPRCAECGAVYDDGVEYCFVDGSPLRPEGEEVGAPSIAPPGMVSSSGDMKPTPELERFTKAIEENPDDLPTAPLGSKAPEAIAPLPPPPRGGGRAVGVVLGAAMVAILCAGVGAGLTVAMVGGGEGEGMEVAPAALPPAPGPAPAPALMAAPAPAPVEEALRIVDVTSHPDGAEVWEDGALRCVTPCKLAHPPGQSLPRRLVFKRGGYQDLEVEVEDLSAPVRGELVAKPPSPRSAPAPRPRPVAEPKPKPTPKPVPGLRTER